MAVRPRDLAGAHEPVEPSVLAALRRRLAAPLQVGVSEAKRIVTAILATVREAGGLCRFDETVTLVADLLGIDQGMAASVPSDESVRQERAAHAAPDVAIDRQPEQRDFLARVWQEVRQLPIRQRVALLLDLRDDDQRDALTMAGVVTHEELSACVGMLSVELTALLPALPQEDGWIAAKLGLTRRQVINLRTCARERLTRRLGFSRGGRRQGASS